MERILKGLAVVYIALSVLGYMGWMMFIAEGPTSIEQAHKYGTVVLLGCLAIVIGTFVIAAAFKKKSGP